MKHSIYKIFKNLNLLLLISLTISFIGFLFMVEQHYSYIKVENLLKHKAIFNKIIEEEKISNEVDIINFNANLAVIHHEIEQLKYQNSYNYISMYLTKNNAQDKKDMQTIYIQVKKFDRTSRNYFKTNHNKKELSNILRSLLIQHSNIIVFIDALIIKNISYDSDRFKIFSKIFLLLLLTLFISTIWQKKRLHSIYEDILLLSALDTEKKNKVIFSQEIDIISMKMKRKTKSLITQV